MSHRPLRVLIASDHLASAGGLHGVAQFMLRFMPSVDPAHVRFVPVILRRRDRFAEAFEQNGVSLRFLGRGKNDPRALLDFMRIIRDERIDLLHVMNIKCDVIGRIAGIMTGRPVLVHGHDTMDVRPAFVRIVDRSLGPRTEHGIAVSRHVAEYMARRRSIPAHAIDVIYLGLDLTVFRRPTAAERAAARAKLGVSGDELVIGTLGRLDRIKGLDVLVEAAATIARRFPTMRLMMAGEGTEEQPLRAQIEQRGLADHVELIGFQDPWPFLAALDLFVMPSRSEGGGTALLEAMALGLCVVASDVGGIPELVEHEHSGLLAPVGDADTLAAACLRALESPALRAELGATAAAFVHESFSLDRTVTRITAVYDRMVG
jgi:glycosyltransferase involved in cell wall biosynthesis